VRLDPFRIQILTLSLDSQIVLTVVGLAVAGLVLRRAARQAGLDLGAAHWWDLVFYAAIGGRLVWVVTHAEYYLRQPLQIAGLLDGGLHPVGLAIGAAVWVWRLSRGGGAPSRRAGDGPPWRAVVDLIAIGFLTAYLFERVGCALTTCGTGPLSDAPWAILRGDEWRTPLALEQVVILAVGLVVAAETVHVRGAACITMLIASVLVEAVAFSAGRASVEHALALGVLAATYASIAWCVKAVAAKGADRLGNGPVDTGIARR
jgi:prolipoprotein diacylglyceryltransferase